MSAPRHFKPIELAIAMRMHRQGASWKKIARALGRKSGAGIRCRLDPEYRAEHNAYHADYKRERRDNSAKEGLPMNCLFQGKPPQTDEQRKLELMRKATSTASTRRAINGNVKTGKNAPRPITLPKMPWDEEKSQ